MKHSGPTRSETKLSEAESYANLARANKCWNILSKGSMADFEKTIVLEERALDSFHNLLFGLTKFYEQVRNWPQRIMIISHDFKRARFLDLHCKAIRWRLEKVVFVGIDPPYMAVDLERAAEVRGRERKEGYERWKHDPFGVGDEVRKHQEMKNPWRVGQSLFEDANIGTKSELVLSEQGVLDHRILQPWQKLS